jgi:polyphosphate glucokinase
MAAKKKAPRGRARRIRQAHQRIGTRSGRNAASGGARGKAVPRTGALRVGAPGDAAPRAGVLHAGTRGKAGRRTAAQRISTGGEGVSRTRVSRIGKQRKGSAGAGVRRGDNPPRSGTPAPAPGRILVLDVGGSHVKLHVGERGKAKKMVTGPKMSAAAMVKGILELIGTDDYDAVSIGYPGMVLRGRIAAEPFNLGKGWMGFDFEKALGKPVRIINDAAMQAVGSYTGGRMLFLGLGTGMGATLVLDGVVEPMEFGHLPYKNGRTYEQYVGERALERLGKKKWRKEVADVVAQLSHALEVDYTVLGGGNVRLLKRLPKGAKAGANSNAMTGGRLIWEATGSPLVLSPKYQGRAAKQRR